MMRGIVIVYEDARRSRRVFLVARITFGAGHAGTPHWHACGPPQGRSGWFSQTQPQSSQMKHFMRQISAYPLVEVDHLAPIEAGVDPSDRAADGALEVRRYVVPIPGRQLGKSEPAVVVAAAVIAARKLCRPRAIDQHGFEAGLLIDGTRPIF
jgi:hypothetical protein